MHGKQYLLMAHDESFSPAALRTESQFPSLASPGAHYHAITVYAVNRVQELA